MLLIMNYKLKLTNIQSDNVNLKRRSKFILNTGNQAKAST